MFQIIHQTHKEKVAMYMKCKKKDLAEMLTSCNELLDLRPMTVEMISDTDTVISTETDNNYWNQRYFDQHQ